LGFGQAYAQTDFGTGLVETAAVHVIFLNPDMKGRHYSQHLAAAGNRV